MIKITYEEENVALVMGITSLRYGGCSHDLSSPCLGHEICVYQDSNTCYECLQILRQPTNSVQTTSSSSYSVQNP